MQRMLKELPSERTVDSNKIQTGERLFVCKCGRQISCGNDQKASLRTHGAGISPIWFKVRKGTEIR
jgi:hypothetical protein